MPDFEVLMGTPFVTKIDVQIEFITAEVPLFFIAPKTCGLPQRDYMMNQFRLNKNVVFPVKTT